MEKEHREKLEELAKKCQAGDKESFSQIYDLLADKIYKFVFFKCKSEDCDDLVEVIFIKIWEKINLYEDSNGYFSAWVYKIAHNTVIDYYRKHRPILSIEESLGIEDEDEEKNPLITTEKKLNGEIVRLALEKLKEPYKEIIILKYIQDLSNEEIAEITGRSHVSIRVISHRALSKLKKILEKTFQ